MARRAGRGSWRTPPSGRCTASAPWRRTGPGGAAWASPSPGTGGNVLVGHGGGYPGYTTQTVFDPRRRVGVIVLTNAQDGGPGAMAGQLMPSVGDAVAQAIHAPAPAVAWGVRFVEENGKVVRMITGDSFVERVRD